MVELGMLLGSLAVAWGVFLLLDGESARLARRLQDRERPAFPAGLVSGAGGGTPAFGPAVAGVLVPRRHRAATRLRPRELWPLGGGVGGLLLGKVLALPPLALPVLGVLGVGLGVGWQARRRAAEQRQLEEALPLALERLASALRAGMSLQTALHELARETPPPLGTELHRLLGEVRLGTPLARAIETLARRVPGREIRMLAVALEVQQETGGPLADVLETVAETLRARARLRGQVQALTAEVRLSALVLGVLPAVLLGVLFVLSPAYMQPFLQSATGQWLLLGAGVLQGVGFVLMRRLGTIDV